MLMFLFFVEKIKVITGGLKILTKSPMKKRVVAFRIYC